MADNGFLEMLLGSCSGACSVTFAFKSAWRCCINLVRAVDVYAQRSRGQTPIKSDSRVICLIFPRKYARTYTRKVSRRHTTVSGIGRPIMQA
ncbi:MAG: hypothetical protein E5299_02353 [Burkholderia gladioli]|nr:MAG: hypothetical protein E5299_02353 [Burkholderia gladioli]